MRSFVVHHKNVDIKFSADHAFQE